MVQRPDRFLEILIFHTDRTVDLVRSHINHFNIYMCHAKAGKESRRDTADGSHPSADYGHKCEICVHLDLVRIEQAPQGRHDRILFLLIFHARQNHTDRIDPGWQMLKGNFVLLKCFEQLLDEPDL